MIVLDANVLIVDLGFPGDPNYIANRQFLNRTTGMHRGIAMQGLLEVVGVRSYNTSAKLISALPGMLAARYGLTVLPDPVALPHYAGCTFDEVVAQMVMKMSLGDSIMALQIARFAPAATELVTWNAKHFVGKVVIPVLTPVEWLARQAPPSP